jgi:hypothetical protein
MRHALADPSTNRLFVACAGDGTARAFDAATFQPVFWPFESRNPSAPLPYPTMIRHLRASYRMLAASLENFTAASGRGPEPSRDRQGAVSWSRN